VAERAGRTGTGAQLPRVCVCWRAASSSLAARRQDGQPGAVVVAQGRSGPRSSALQAAQLVAAFPVRTVRRSRSGPAGASDTPGPTLRMTCVGLFGPRSADFRGVVRACLLPADLSALRLRGAACGVQPVCWRPFAALHCCSGSGLPAWAGCLQTASGADRGCADTSACTSALLVPSRPATALMSASSLSAS